MEDDPHMRTQGDGDRGDRRTGMRRPARVRMVTRIRLGDADAIPRKTADPRHLLSPAWHPWEVLIAILVLSTIFSLITDQLRIGPVWLLPSVVAILFIALFAAHLSERREMARRLAMALAGVGTLGVLSSVVVLVVRLIHGSVSAPYLLRDAALLWVANVIVFGLWYWEIDGGGPHQRHLHGYRPTDLAFPQTALGGRMAAGWIPDFIDYLFVAFNASTAFSPTDTSILSARAKVLMMLQSLMSIVLLAVVAARAINILN